MMEFICDLPPKYKEEIEEISTKDNKYYEEKILPILKEIREIQKKNLDLLQNKRAHIQATGELMNKIVAWQLGPLLYNEVFNNEKD